jgi:hypothetical protein
LYSILKSSDRVTVMSEELKTKLQIEVEKFKEVQNGEWKW